MRSLGGAMVIALLCGWGALASARTAPSSLERLVDLAPGNVTSLIVGRQDKDQLGNDLRAGDVNGDGVADLAIGAHWGSTGGRNIQGRSYVLFGGPDRGALVDLANIANSNWSFMGAPFESRLGSALAIGDLSGDGVGDLALGSVLADPNGQSNGGAVYVMYGGAKAGGHVDFLSAKPDVLITGGSRAGGEADRIGTDLVTGDFNGDGHVDLAVAASFRSEFRGTVFVWWGPLVGGTSYNLQDSNADWTILGPVSGAYLGTALAAADVNGDGVTDLLASAYAPTASATGDTGAVFVFFGRHDRGGTVDLATTPADITVVGPPGAFLGAAQSPGSCSCRGQSLQVADLTGDGVPDLLIGAPLAETRHGAAYVVAGPLETGTIDLATRPRLRLAGTATEGRAGWSVAAGHLDRDDHLDVIVAAPWAVASGRSTAGLFYGLRGPLPTQGNVDLTEASAPFLARGGETGGGNAGATVVLADTNGDGVDDLHIGLPDSAPLGRRSVGAVYVLKGPILATLPTATPTATDTSTLTPEPTRTTTATATPVPSATTSPTATLPATASDTPTPARPSATATGTVRASATRRATATATVNRRARLYLPFGLKPRRRG
jgi:hypothetical protein